MKRTIYLGLLLLLKVTAYTQVQLGIAASPMKTEFNTPRGGNQNMIVSINNPSNRLLEIRANLNDWQRDSTGNIITLPAGSLPTSCSEWISIFPATNFTLQPGERKEITVSLAVPDSATDKVRNSMLFFNQMNPQRGKNENGINIDIAVRIGIQIYYTPPSLHKKNIDILDFKDMPSHVADSMTGKVLLLSLQNTGEIVADGKADLELVSLTNGKKTVLPQAAFYTLPGAIRTIEIPLSAALPPGKYSATALIDYGREEELKIGELEFNYLPKKL